MNEAYMEAIAALVMRYSATLTHYDVEGLGIVKCELDSGLIPWAIQVRLDGKEFSYYLAKSDVGWMRTSVWTGEEVIGESVNRYVNHATLGLRKDAEPKFVDIDELEPFFRFACSVLDEARLQRLYLVRALDSQGGVPLDGWGFFVRRLTGERRQFPRLFVGTTDYNGGIISELLDVESGPGVAMSPGRYKSTDSLYKALLKKTGRDPDTEMRAPRFSAHPLMAYFQRIAKGLASYHHC